MLGFIVSIVFIIWFFSSAKKAGKNPWGWAIIGFLSYYIPVLTWGLILKLVLPGLGIRISSDGGAIAFGLAIGMSAVLVGATIAALVRSKILLKNHQIEYEYKCAECNAVVKEEDKFCPECGVNLED